MNDRTCVECDAPISGHPSRRYCSSRCKWMARKRSDGIPCTVCGEPTGWTRRSGKTDATHKACARNPCGTVASYKRGCRCADCRAAIAADMREYYASRKAQGRPMRQGRKNRKAFNGFCERCGSEFQSEREQRFCSMKCFGRYNSQRQRNVYSTELVRYQRPEVVAPPTPVTVVTSPKWWGVIVNGPCAWCGESFTALSGAAKYCSQACSRKVDRARRGDFMPEPRFRYAIYRRDAWTCQLCFEPVDRDPCGDDYNPWSPSLDHIIPRSHGGADSWENLRLAHAWCNSVRGAEDYHPDLFEEASNVPLGVRA